MNDRYQTQVFRFLSVLMVLTIRGQSQTFLIGNTEDSVSITDGTSRLVARLFWSANAISGANDNITATVLEQPKIPPAAAGRNYSLASTIQVSPVALSSVRFTYGAVRLRLYADTSSFRVRDLMGSIPNSFHIEAQRHLPPAAFHPLYTIRHDTTLDYVDVLLDSVSTSSSFLLTATNILYGILNPGNLGDTLKANVLIPGRKTLQLNPGTRLVTSNFSIIVRGSIKALGTQQDSVVLRAGFTVIGKADATIGNNLEQLFCSFTSGSGFELNSANAVIRDSRFSGMSIQGYSSIQLKRTVISTFASCAYSHVAIDSCRFLPDAFITSSYSILKIENSLFENITFESTHRYGLLHLKNNTIYADASLEPFQPLRCFVLYEGNTLLFSGTSNSNKAGFSVYEGNYAIIRNNIVRGFRNAVEVGYNNKATIYNNTFVQSGGVALYGTVDSVSVYNNIFAGHGGVAINVDVSTGNRQDNRVWVDSNAYFSGQYINADTAGTGIVIGNTFSLNADPQFTDTVTYRLKQGSQAIDRGARVIPSFTGTFSVLDTVILLPASLSVTDYIGSRPDLGAREHDPSLGVFSRAPSKLPSEFTLDQNYPNPFNPSTTIRFEIPTPTSTSLKIFNLLGQEVAMLLNEELSPGMHSVNWDAKEIPSGVYFYRLQAGADVVVQWDWELRGLDQGRGLIHQAPTEKENRNISPFRFVALAIVHCSILDLTHFGGKV